MPRVPFRFLGTWSAEEKPYISMYTKRGIVNITKTTKLFISFLLLVYLGSKPAQKQVHSVWQSWTNLHCLLMERLGRQAFQTTIICTIWDWLAVGGTSGIWFLPGSEPGMCWALNFVSKLMKTTQYISSFPPTCERRDTPLPNLFIQGNTVQHLRLNSVEFTRISLQTADFSSGWRLQMCGFTL